MRPSNLQDTPSTANHQPIILLLRHRRASGMLQQLLIFWLFLPGIKSFLSPLKPKRTSNNVGASVKPDVTGSPRTVVILNRKARSVTKDIEPLAIKVFGQANVFVTSSENEARIAAKHIAEHIDDVELIVPVGGDGTLAATINMLCEEIDLDADTAMGKLPPIGYIPMGTGNAVGSAVGIRPSRSAFLSSVFRRKKSQLEEVFRRLVHFNSTGEQESQVVEMPMIQASLGDQNADHRRELCFFAGVGFDSLMLNDFKTLKQWSQKSRVLNGLGSVAGYCVALLTMTLPKCVMNGAHKIRVELTTNDQDCLWVDHRRGDVAIPCAGTHLYTGTTGILAASTSPFYGGRMRLFPFARMTKDKMQLRVGRIHPLKGFLNIPRIFSGSYRDTSQNRFGCLDFIGGDFEVKVEACRKVSGDEVPGYPFQHSGESVGDVDRFRLRVLSKPVRFVSLLPRRIELDE